MPAMLWWHSDRTERLRKRRRRRRRRRKKSGLARGRRVALSCPNLVALLSSPLLL